MPLSPVCDVVVVGAGLAGLSAAAQLAHTGADVQVLEAAPRVGGRVYGAPVEAGVMDTGAEFLGRPHRRLRALVASLGLHVQPSRLERAPTLWRLPDQHRASRLPPVPSGELYRLARAWWRLRRQALTLPPDRPWSSPAAAGLDAVSLADWLTGHGVTRRGLDVAAALIEGFATRPIEAVSAAHAAWWITAASGLLPALRSGQQYVVRGGAHQVPHLLARRLGDRVHLNTAVTSIVAHRHGVEICTDEQHWSAGAAIIAVPVPALRRLTIDPPPAADFRTAVERLSYGSAVKIAAVATAPPKAPHRTVVGGEPLAIAWRRGRLLAGIATAGATATELSADLATAFGLTTSNLSHRTVTDWTRQHHIGGSYLIYHPGQLTAHAAALHTDHHHGRLHYAGSDFSHWPNSMEGAVRSGQAAATRLLRNLQG